LDWYFNVLSRRLTVKSARVIELDSEMDELRRAHQAADTKERFRIDREISALEQEEEALQAECALLVRALCNTKDYIDACERIKSKRLGPIDTPDALIVHSDTSVMEFLETSNFEQATLIATRGALHPIFRDEEAEASRDRFIDGVCFQLGVKPIRFETGSRKQKSEKYKGIAGILIEGVGRPELRALEAGLLRIQDVGVEAKLRSLLCTSMEPALGFKETGSPTGA
jgi:hypothetical protein